MIDFVTINDVTWTLITDEDYTEARKAMRDAGLTQSPIWRAYTDDVEEIGGVDGTGVASCSVIQTDCVLVA